MAIRKISIGVVGGVIVIGLLAGAWFMLGGKPSSPSPQANEAAKIENETPPPDPTKHSYFEINFAKQMIIYNQQAVDLANIVQHGGSDKEVQDLAGEVIAAHGKAADQYATWLREWNETYLSLSDFPRSDDHDGYPTNPGMPRVVEEQGDELIAKRVIESSRKLYAKKAEVAEAPKEKTQAELAPTASKKQSKPKKKPAKKADDKLATMKSI